MIAKYQFDNFINRLRFIMNIETDNTEYQKGVFDALDYMKEADKGDKIYKEDIEIMYMIFKMSHNKYCESLFKEYCDGVKDTFNIIRAQEEDND